MQFTVHITYYRKIVGNISIEKNRTSFYSNKKYSQKIKLKNECTLREQNKKRKKGIQRKMTQRRAHVWRSTKYKTLEDGMAFVDNFEVTHVR